MIEAFIDDFVVAIRKILPESSIYCCNVLTIDNNAGKNIFFIRQLFIKLLVGQCLRNGYAM